MVSALGSILYRLAKKSSFNMEAKDITWNATLETLIAEEGEKCCGNAWLHAESEKHFSRHANVIAIPVIVLSTLAGSANMASSTLFNNPAVSSVAIGALSIVTGIISTIGSYFAWAKRAETHRICAIQYAKLARYLTIEMSLPASERLKAADLLKITREQIERLLEISPAVPDSIILAYRNKFATYTDIAHPESTNGLHKVAINHTVAAPNVSSIKVEIKGRDVQNVKQLPALSRP